MYLKRLNEYKLFSYYPIVYLVKSIYKQKKIEIGKHTDTHDSRIRMCNFCICITENLSTVMSRESCPRGSKWREALKTILKCRYTFQNNARNVVYSEIAAGE